MTLFVHIREFLIFSALTVGAAVTISTSLAQEPTSTHLFEVSKIGETLDFKLGSVQSNRSVEVPFEVKNTSDIPFVPKFVNRSCGCMDVEFPEGQWKPGETKKGILKVDASPTKSFGGTVVFDDQDKIMLFKFNIYGEIKPLFSATPPVFTIHASKISQDIEFEINRNFDYVDSELLVVSQALPSVGRLVVNSRTKESVKCTLVVERGDLFDDGVLRDLTYCYLGLTWKSTPGDSLSDALMEVGYPDGLTVPLEIEDVPKITPKLVRLRRSTSETMECDFLVRSGESKTRWGGAFVKLQSTSRIPASLEWNTVNKSWSKLRVRAELTQEVLEDLRSYRIEIYNEDGLHIHSASIFNG